MFVTVRPKAAEIFESIPQTPGVKIRNIYTADSGSNHIYISLTTFIITCPDNM